VLQRGKRHAAAARLAVHVAARHVPPAPQRRTLQARSERQRQCREQHLRARAGRSRRVSTPVSRDRVGAVAAPTPAEASSIALVKRLRGARTAASAASAHAPRASTCRARASRCSSAAGSVHSRRSSLRAERWAMPLAGGPCALGPPPAPRSPPPRNV
jgi:hypothetical protein